MTWSQLGKFLGSNIQTKALHAPKHLCSTNDPKQVFIEI